MDGWPRHGAWPGAVAVSGGGDSLALMHLLRGLGARRASCAPPVVLTVDHGLRTDRPPATPGRSRAWAKQAGLKAHVLTWHRRQAQKPASRRRRARRAIA